MNHSECVHPDSIDKELEGKSKAKKNKEKGAKIFFEAHVSISCRITPLHSQVGFANR